MRVSRHVWVALTQIERLAMLEFASAQNTLRWQKRKVALAEAI